MASDLWKYCDKAQAREALLSLGLTGNLALPEKKQLSLLYGLANHAEEHYKKVQIPKRNGKIRILYVPDSLLKYIQKQILHNVLMTLPLSPCASAYKKGCSLRENALPHLEKPTVLKLDISDFFGNITFISVYQHAFPGELFPPSLRTLLAHLCCYRDFLPQGAPTSPYISNLVMLPFDRYMENWCRSREITYTRYCDDLTFSGSFNPSTVIHKASSFLLRVGFQVNPEKTRISTQGQRQSVTGIVVNKKAQLPKEYRRRLRQEIYYIEKFGIKEHLEKIHSSSDPEKYLESLEGKVRYVLQINPLDREFSEALTRLNNIRISESR